MKCTAAIGNLLVITGLVAGCEVFNSDRILGENITILNGTSDAVEVFTVRDGVEWTLATIEAGRGYRISAAQFPDGCMSGPFVARADDGTLLGTHEAELCSDDTWEVGAKATPSGS